MVVTRIRSIASLALCGQTKLTDALREIVDVCNSQGDHVVTLTVDEAEALATHCDTSAAKRDAERAVMRQLNELAEQEQSDLHERHRAKQF